MFPNEAGEYMDESALRRRFKDALTRAELQSIRFHDLRHSFGTLAVQAFLLSDVRGYMGHAGISTTMVYRHHVPRPDAADKLTALVQGSGDFATLPEAATNRTPNRTPNSAIPTELRGSQSA